MTDCSHGWPASGCSDHWAVETQIAEAAERLRKAFDWIDIDSYARTDLRVVAAIALGIVPSPRDLDGCTGLGWSE